MKGFRIVSGSVGNADRKCKTFSLRSKIWSPRMGNQIWASTPQNRTYRAWMSKIGRKNRELNSPGEKP